MDTNDSIQTIRDGAALTVTLNRPTVGNALRGEDATLLAELFDEVTAGSDVRVVRLRSEGKHFCTGADLSGSNGSTAPVVGHMVRSLAASYHRCIASVFDCRVPVVAEVQGASIGFGLNLALAADFVVASDQAQFTAPFADRGFSVDSGGSWLLPRLVGLTRAKQMIYLGKPVTALDAYSWGLIAECVDHASLDERVSSLVAQLGNGPTQSIAASKRVMHDHLGTDLAKALHGETMAVELTLRSKDFKEGMRSFAEKRPPQFTGE